MKRYFISLTLATLLIGNEANRINSQVTGEGAQITSGGTIINRQDTSGIYNYNEVTYEHIKAFQSKGTSPQAATKIQFGEGIVERNKQAFAAKQAEEAKKVAMAEQKKAAPAWPRFIEGYCYVKNDIQVEKIATYAYLSCDFADNGGRGELVVSLVPDFYASALIAKPLYIASIDKKTGKKNRIPIVSGAVLTQDKLSINVANVVNDRKIAKIAATGAYTTLNVATKQMQAYMADDREARRKQSVNYTTTNGVTQTVQTTSQEAPVKSDYLVAAGVEIVSELAKVIGEAFVNTLPYTFKVNKDSVWYVDAELSNLPGVRGYDADVPNVVKQQPAFDITTGKEINNAATQIPIREIKIKEIDGTQRNQTLQR